MDAAVIVPEVSDEACLILVRVACCVHLWQCHYIREGNVKETLGPCGQQEPSVLPKESGGTVGNV